MENSSVDKVGKTCYKCSSERRPRDPAHNNAENARPNVVKMENVIVRIFPMNCLKISRATWIRQCLSKKCYSTKVQDTQRKLKHPYRNIHPWKSLEEFSKSLVAGVIHNENGLVVINKPYGISGNRKTVIDNPDQKNTVKLRPSGIVGEVKYTVSDALPHIAQELGYTQLKIIVTPERFTTGVTLLAADDTVEKLVGKSLIRATSFRILPKTYWAITTRVPNEIKGEKRLAMQMQQAPDGKSQLPIIKEVWSHNQHKRQEIKKLSVQFKIISNSTNNLSSLMEIKSSTKTWHALRLFAATVLYSPILGDNICGSRVQNIMGKWMNISPFVDAAQLPPKLNKDLLCMLNVPAGKESMIPAHLHLREICLLSYGSNNSSNLILTAPPMPEFAYTARQLKFKHEAFESDEENDDNEDAAEHPDPVRYENVT